MKTRPFFNARTALALAALAVFGAAAPAAQALGVGRLDVQSALGEGLRAEIDITSLSSDEAASLAVRIASPEAYRAAGVDYNAVLAGAQAVVARRADGRSFLRLSSDRAVQEPFIEVIVELNWASGRLVREFTLLFDPPGSRPAQAAALVAPVAPVMSAAFGPAALAPPASAASALPAAPSRPVPVLRQTTAAPAAEPVAAAPRPAVLPRTPSSAAWPNPPSAPSAAAKRYPVRPGDTLYGVAGSTQHVGVSLDQMLVGLSRANPDAFIEHTVNRLRAGVVLSVPSADEVRDVTPDDLRRLITAQSVDFEAYRNRLAQGAPQAQSQEPIRAVQGKVQAAVDDRKQSGAASPDKLKLSGGAGSAPEALIAQAAERKDNADRVAELSRNVEELKQLRQGAVAVQAAAGPTAASASPPPGSGPTPVVASSVAAASQPGKPVAPPAAPSGSLIDSVSDSPWLLPGAGGLALLLAGIAAWRLRGRLHKGASETSFLESRMQPDSFFGASGGQHVDTRDASRIGAGSVGYSLSQLDAIGDVDPVAEADVYLAYGRDLQAEEILKEAMRTTPERMAVRSKLLEVYAKRRDSKGFELLATQLYALTKGSGADWSKAQELGRQFDADNPLYQPGGHPEEIILDGERVVVEPLGATTQPHSILPQVTLAAEDSRQPQFGDGGDGFDLDLDLGQPDPVRSMEATRPMVSGAQRSVDPGLDFDVDDRGEAAQRPAPPPSSPAPRTVAVRIDSRAMGLVGAQAGAGDSLMDFSDFAMSGAGGLAEAAPTVSAHLDDLAMDQADPLARKFELAEEFRQIGDVDGARDLLEEVVSKATGTLRGKAQAMLDALS